MDRTSLLVLCYLFYAISTVRTNDIKERNCPPPEKMKPCVCSNVYPEASLSCKNIDSVETLRNIFQNAARHVFREVSISNSSLAYLPHEMFSRTKILELTVSDTTMIEFLDESPAGADSTNHIIMRDLELQRHVIWDQLKTFTNLKDLNVENVHIKILGDAFRMNVNNYLEKLDFKGTGTRRIMPGTLVPFINLQRIVFTQCELKNLTRDMFPNPFNVYTFIFSDNQISEIPDDLFSNMPNIGNVSLAGNRITTLSRAAVENMWPAYYLDLTGNPLECDCRILEWRFLNWDQQYFGNCKNLNGKSLMHLGFNDFNCND